MSDDNYKVYVDATILGRHNVELPKNAYVAYVVDGRKELWGVKLVEAKETDEAECEAILFAIDVLKAELPRFTIVCDHQSVVREATKPTENPKAKRCIKEIRKELENSGKRIMLEEFPINPAHILLNEHLVRGRN
ncbi:MAG: reverse transcriptase-like protein [Nitrososphaerales archaeon]